MTDQTITQNKLKTTSLRLERGEGQSVIVDGFIKIVVFNIGPNAVKFGIRIPNKVPFVIEQRSRDRIITIPTNRKSEFRVFELGTDDALVIRREIEMTLFSAWRPCDSGVLLQFVSPRAIPILRTEIYLAKFGNNEDL